MRKLIHFECIYADYAQKNNSFWVRKYAVGNGNGGQSDAPEGMGLTLV